MMIFIHQFLKTLFSWLPEGKEKDSQRYVVSVWLVLFLLIVVLVSFVLSKKEQPLEEDFSNGTTLRFELIGQYALGFKQIIKETADIEEKERIYSGLIQQAQEAASSNADKISMAVILAELYSKDEALTYLRDLEKDYQTTRTMKYDIAVMKEIYTKDQNWTPSKRVREIFLHRYQWFGKLALTGNMISDDPIRTALFQKAKGITNKVLVFSSLLGIAILTGCALFILAVIWLIKKKLTFAGIQSTENEIQGSVVFLETVVVFLFMMMAGALLPGYMPGWFSIIWHLLTILVVFWPWFRGKTRQDSQRAFGLKTDTSIIREMGAGIVGYLAATPIVLIGMGLSLIISKFSGIIPIHPIVNSFQEANTWRIIQLVFLICIFAPIIEEIVFRGAFYFYLRQRYSAWISAAITGIIFAIIHPQGLVAVPVLGALGFVFALIREWRQSLIASISAHAFNNTIITILLISLVQV